MNLVFSTVLVLSTIQLIIGKHLRWWFILLITLVINRSLFLLRMKGIVVKVKPLVITDALMIFFEIVLGVVSKKGINILLLILFTLLSIAVVILEIIDDKFYVYKVEDEKTEE